ncbi:MAG: hypothetical protein HW400_19 [Candidatus Levybacteria bacterium]|nr:hypothetical protein [Candidatus Levybacteria bacterium]
MRHEKIIIGVLAFVSFYMVFWLWFFDTPKSYKNTVNIPKKLSSFSPAANNNLVLGDKVEPQQVLPVSYKIPLDPRRQSFNLSCEFAAASSIIFHFTNNPSFAVVNEIEAEKKLINKMWISRNPNVGIRMGLANVMSLDNLYSNLNQWFGGADYYGIHAPPFIDLFQSYHLTAKPIYINDSTISAIKEAISKNHLVMAWIKIGYAKPVDDELSYGKVKIIRGEHAVVVNGYDESGVIVMDPAIGLERHVGYSSLLDASMPFPMPFLEVSENVDDKMSWDNLTVGFDTLTGIDRSIPKIFVENGTRITGAANQMRDVLKDFGYNINSISNADNFDYQDIGIQAKKSFSDFLYILNRDIKLAGYIVASSSADLGDDEGKDMVIVVGK